MKRSYFMTSFLRIILKKQHDHQRTWEHPPARQRVPGVVVGGQEQTVRVPQVARRFGQFEKSQLVVMPHQHRLDVRGQGAVVDGGVGLVRRLLHAGDARLLQLPAQPVAAHDEHLAADLDHVPQVESRAVGRAEDLLQHHVGEAQAAELVHVILARPGAVVGDEHHVLAAPDERVDHLDGARDRLLPVPDDPVAVEQDEVLGREQIPDLRSPDFLAAFEGKGARHAGGFLGLLRLSAASGSPCPKLVHHAVDEAEEWGSEANSTARNHIAESLVAVTYKGAGFINIDVWPRPCCLFGPIERQRLNQSR